MLATISAKKNFLELRTLLMLAAPLMFAQLVEASFSFCSTIFLAHLGPKALAAGSLTWTLFITLMVLVWGILIAVSTLVAQRHGAKDSTGIAQVLKDGLLLAVILMIPAMLVLWHGSDILLFFHQQPSLVAAATTYLHGLTFSIPTDFISLVLLQFAIGLGHTRIAVIFNLLWVIIGLLVGHALIFGQWGFPTMGVAGMGWGVATGNIVATVFLLIYFIASKKYRSYLLLAHQQKYGVYLRQLLTIGLPLASMFCLEVGFFTAVTLLMGFLGSETLAAHQITTQYTWLLGSVFIFCMAQAITVRVGHCFGAGDIASAERASYLGALISASLMFVVALCYWFLPQLLIAVDLDLNSVSNQTVIHLAKHFLALAAVFEIAEGIRFALFGALRGLGETRFSMLVSLFTFWCLAFPLGYFLAVHQKWGGSGIWWSMIVGATIGSLLLFWRLQKIFKNNYGKNCLSN
jgi:MATE family multidrug resistance protein